MKLFLILFLIISPFTFGQDTIRKVLDLKGVTVTPKRKIIKPLSLYDEEVAQPYSIKGFDQLELFDNELSEEVWSTKNVNCISLSLKTDVKDTFLQVKWNKDQDGCDWVGMGYGWDMWSGKDMAAVRDTLAIQLLVRSTGKAFTNIPWAFGFEDYSGNQAWLGYNGSFLKAKEIGSEWTKVEIPLALFPFEENDFDLFNVKQLIVQLFSEGIIDINSIQLVPFSKKLKEEIDVTVADSPIHIDGNLTEWKNTPFTTLESGHKFALHYSKDTLFLAAHLKDSTSIENNMKGGDLWKGDAIELAFSTNSAADTKRNYYLLSDQHIGLNCGTDSYCWDFKRKEKIDAIPYKIMPVSDGYLVEMAIPFNTIYSRTLETGKSYGFEFAVDMGGKGGTRQKQDRWNSPSVEGFHLNPSKWGIIHLK